MYLILLHGFDKKWSLILDNPVNEEIASQIVNIFNNLDGLHAKKVKVQ